MRFVLAVFFLFSFVAQASIVQAQGKIPKPYQGKIPKPYQGKIPKPYQGVWAMPSCGEAEEVWMVTPRYLLVMREENARLQRITRFVTHGDYSILQTETAEQPMQRQEDGILLLPEGVSQGTLSFYPLTWEKLSLTHTRAFMHCFETPPLVPVPLARVMQDIEPLSQACAQGLANQECQQTLFHQAFLAKKQKALQAKDIKRSMASLSVLATLADSMLVATSTLETAFQQGKTTAESWIQAYGRAWDKDDSGDWTWAEVKKGIESLTSEDDSTDFQVFRHQLSSIFAPQPLSNHAKESPKAPDESLKKSK